VGKKFWEGLIDWIKQIMLDEFKNISPEDLNLFTVVDTPEEVVDVVDEFYRKYALKPNF
jgi:predicted Rossmann-fold nucleotide-binding protein